MAPLPMSNSRVAPARNTMPEPSSACSDWVSSITSCDSSWPSGPTRCSGRIECTSMPCSVQGTALPPVPVSETGAGALRRRPSTASSSSSTTSGSTSHPCSSAGVARASVQAASRSTCRSQFSCSPASWRSRRGKGAGGGSQAMVSTDKRAHVLGVDAARREGRDEGDPVAERIVVHQVAVGCDQRPQVVAESDVDRRAVVERADAYAEDPALATLLATFGQRIHQLCRQGTSGSTSELSRWRAGSAPAQRRV